ncbi:uroporphyrinogen-III synthase [Bacillus canaveralius]|uniref:Uroporphyrinogen-III synthase n=1 Tax=Bacillus canaveralius TaxID=1403243 RepID=A0A2N5GQ44_9BACI|nr:uroporphyrinogen-III synthase [Bacillus canaveralius]PLR85000.1 uroporphyrinogen-III synthase [Bacillus canaveralius]PLR93261.1 uroporphyrinogen-III synthase [Bacillus canaveralius]RSK52461.1 uroporphyrinogen-III synthase [Bacillus canaveralius]
MTAALPLQGKTVLIPRSKKQASSFSDLVRRYGGIPVEIPLIDFKAAEKSAAIVKACENLHTYNWIIFTSSVTVETFFSFLPHFQSDSFPKIAAIGEKTRQRLLKKGLVTGFTPSEYVAEAFVKEFLPLLEGGEKILLPKGNLARGYIAESLRKAGAAVDELIIYETFLPPASRSRLTDMIKGKQLDILTFTSPSIVDHFFETAAAEGLKDSVNDCLVACIGPVTKARAEFYGLIVHVMPDTYTVQGMVNNLATYLTSGGNNNESTI